MSFVIGFLTQLLHLALMLALRGDTVGAERLARKDLPKEMADLNAEYYRYLAGGQ